MVDVAKYMKELPKINLPVEMIDDTFWRFLNMITILIKKSCMKDLRWYIVCLPERMHTVMLVVNILHAVNAVALEHTKTSRHQHSQRSCLSRL